MLSSRCPATITILGSTGSIGVSALKAIDSHNECFSVYGLSCYSNIELLCEQIRMYKPEVVAIGLPEENACYDLEELKKEYPGIEFLTGPEGLLRLAEREVDIIISAIIGAAGLLPTMKAIPNIKRLVLANKETLVMAGELFIQKVREYGVELIPVDSEHNAIFMLLDGLNKADIKRIILTASGGSLRNKTMEELRYVVPEEALAHPTWNMGSKITIDSATLMNKGYEVIEAHHLFDMEYDCIDVVVHPESIVHSMVETVDGAVYAQLSVADMVLPILNALCYPEKKKNPFGKLEITEIGTLSFEKYDSWRFPALDLCYEAGRIGGTVPAVLNGANEIAVNKFLNGEIAFTDIVSVVEKTMQQHTLLSNPTLDEILMADQWARQTTNSLIRG